MLDIGCGVGPVHPTLLDSSVGHATAADIAEPMLREARRQAERIGLNDCVDYRVGDFVALAGDFPDADLAVLDKVVCCYENIDASIAKTRRLLAMSFPRDTRLLCLALRIVIGLAKLFGGALRPFLYDWGRMGWRIVGGGFELAQSARTVAWQINIYSSAYR